MPVTALPSLPGEDGGPPDSGSGFGWGERWDRAEPGPLLIAAAERASQQDPGRLSADELAGLLLAHRRVASRVAAMKLAVLAEMAARRAAAPGDARAGERIVDELRCLSDTDAAVADQALASRAMGLRTGPLRVIARPQVLAINPAAARKRREKAERQARVTTRPEPNGTGALSGRDLPSTAALAADRHISALAWALQAAGAPGTADQLRAQVFTALLSGHPVSSLLPAPPDSPSGDLRKVAG